MGLPTEGAPYRKGSLQKGLPTEGAPYRKG